MSVEIDVRYDGGLRCTATHGPSGKTLLTDAPLDNGGQAASFSPTDLVAVALGTCMVTIMGKLAERHGWDIRGTRVHVSKEMAAAPIRRIGTLRTRIELPATRPWAPEDRERLERAAHTCPVKQSLHADVQMPVEFVYPE